MSRTRDADALDALVRLGFTDLEARAYVFLLGEAPATGYRVAQGVGRPGANVYKALESLERKGAVLVDEGDVRHVRPVPVDELLAQLEAGFQRDRDDAESALRSLDETGEDARVYHVATADQVRARAHAMIEGASTDVLIDASPALLEEFVSALRDAHKREVRVGAFTYAPSDVDDFATVVLHPDADGVRSRWPAWLHLNVDGEQALISFLDESGERVEQAIWTASALLSFSLRLGAVSEMSVAALRRAFDEGGSAEEIRERFESLYRRIDPGQSPGYARVQTLLGRSSPPPKPSSG